MGEYMHFDKYLVSIEDQLKSETRDIGPPAPKNKNLKTPTSKPTSSSRVTSTSQTELPPPKRTQPLTSVQRPRPATLYKNFRLDPLSQPFVTPLKRPHRHQSDYYNDRDGSQDLTSDFDDPVDSRDLTADFEDHEESGLELTNSPQNDYERDEEGEGVSHIVFSQSTSSSQAQFAPNFTAESTVRDESETYPISGPWTADAYALFG